MASPEPDVDLQMVCPGAQTPCKETSPDSKCPICLDRFRNVSYADRCFHRFCFRCILEWGKNKAECPLCKQPFSSVYHSVRSEEDFRLYELRPSENGSFGSLHGQRFRYRTTLTHQRQRERRTRGSSHVQEVVRFRRWLYRQGVRVRDVRDGGRSRDTSAEFFRKNPACLHRLVPWLKRELVVLYGSHDSVADVVFHVILSLVTRHDMHNESFLQELRPFLSSRAEHFLHEFLSFAKSPFNMEAYDRHAVYDCPAPSHLPAVSEDDADLSSAPSPWDDETPGPSYSSATQNVFTVTISDSDVDSASEDETIRVIANANVSNTVLDEDDHSSDGDCVIIGFIKPTTQRTPELVQLSSDSEESVQEPSTSNQSDTRRLTNQRSWNTDKVSAHTATKSKSRNREWGNSSHSHRQSSRSDRRSKTTNHISSSWAFSHSQHRHNRYTDTHYTRHTPQPSCARQRSKTHARSRSRTRASSRSRTRASSRSRTRASSRSRNRARSRSRPRARSRSRPRARSRSRPRARSRSRTRARSGSRTRARSGSRTRARSRSRTRARSRSRTRARSGSRTRARSGSRTRARSGSRTRARSGSRTRARSGSRTRARSRSRTRARSRSRTRARSGSRTRARSRSRTRPRSRSRTRPRSRSRTRSRSWSRTRARSRSRTRARSRSRNRAHSRSRTRVCSYRGNQQMQVSVQDGKHAKCLSISPFPSSHRRSSYDKTCEKHKHKSLPGKKKRGRSREKHHHHHHHKKKKKKKKKERRWSSSMEGGAECRKYHKKKKKHKTPRRNRSESVGRSSGASSPTVFNIHTDTLFTEEPTLTRGAATTNTEPLNSSTDSTDNTLNHLPTGSMSGHAPSNTMPPDHPHALSNTMPPDHPHAPLNTMPPDHPHALSNTMPPDHPHAPSNTMPPDHLHDPLNTMPPDHPHDPLNPMPPDHLHDPLNTTG